MAAVMLASNVWGVLSWPWRRLATVGGPAGFLSADRRRALGRWPGIRRAEPFEGTGVLVAVDRGYDGGRGSVDVVVRHYPTSGTLVAREPSLLDNATSILERRASANHWRWDDDAMCAAAARHGCHFDGGRVEADASAPHDPDAVDAEAVAEVALRVARACREIAGLAGRTG
jgi:hypothetical protein